VKGGVDTRHHNIIDIYAGASIIVPGTWYKYQKNELETKVFGTGTVLLLCRSVRMNDIIHSVCIQIVRLQPRDSYVPATLYRMSTTLQ
jgi:hypothetical protein